LVAGATFGKISIFELFTGREVKSFVGHNDKQISALTVYYDNKKPYLLSCAYDKSLVVKAWDLKTCQCVAIYKYGQNVNCIATFRDGENTRMLVLGGDKDIKILKPIAVSARRKYTLCNIL